MIKQRKKGYRYNPNNKSWWVNVSNQELLDEEQKWLTENIYNGYFKGTIQLISVFDKYKEEK